MDDSSVSEPTREISCTFNSLAGREVFNYAKCEISRKNTCQKTHAFSSVWHTHSWMSRCVTHAVIGLSQGHTNYNDMSYQLWATATCNTSPVPTTDWRVEGECSAPNGHCANHADVSSISPICPRLIRSGLANRNGIPATEWF